MCVLEALDLFSRQFSIPVVIMCDLSPHASSYVRNSSYLVEIISFADLSHADYLFLCSSAFCSLTGPSGSCYASSYLFNKPTLIFDSLPFNSFLYHPLCSHLFKHWRYKDYSNSNFDYNFIRDSLPHDNFMLNQRGFSYQNLSPSELLSAFIYYYEALLALPDLSDLGNSYLYPKFRKHLLEYCSQNGFY